MPSKINEYCGFFFSGHGVVETWKPERSYEERASELGVTDTKSILIAIDIVVMTADCPLYSEPIIEIGEW